MKQKKLTVSIGIPAHNEEQNIRNVLQSVLSQREKDTQIKEIFVMSDGSTDKTVKLAKSVKDNRIKVIEYKERQGKPTILNRIFRIFKSSALIIIDADTILNDQSVIEKLVSGLHGNKNAVIVTGNAQPLPGITFLEKAANNYIFARNVTSKNYSLSEAYTARGFIAYSKKFLKGFSLPRDIINDDAYSYFYALTNNHKIFHKEDAIVRYRSAQSVREHTKQFTRYLVGGEQLGEYFGRDIVSGGFKVPKIALIKIMLYQLFKSPLGYILLKALNTYCYYKSKKLVNKLDVKWEVITTSKNLTTTY